MKLDWKSIVSDIAPTIAGALSGGNPVVVGLASTIVKKALGLPANASSDNITQAVQTDPDALVKIRQAETELSAQLADIGYKDRSNARDNNAKTKSKVPGVLAFSITLGFFAILVYMLRFDIPITNKTELDMILGSLGTAWIAVVTYYFGSSAGSRDKDDTIQNMSK